MLEEDSSIQRKDILLIKHELQGLEYWINRIQVLNHTGGIYDGVRNPQQVVKSEIKAISDIAV